MLDVSPYLLLLLLGSIAWTLTSSAPGAYAYRKAKREYRAERKAEAAVARVSRQAHRRQVCGSHPVLYWGLAWLGAPVLLCVATALMGW
jgi:hypothetical protein